MLSGQMEARLKVLAFTKDLMFSSRIREALSPQADVMFARSADELLSATRGGSVRVVILDLANAEARRALEFAKKEIPDVFCAGYYPHVQKETAEEFKKLGCDEVMPRSRFVREMAGLVERVSGNTGG